MPLTHVGADGRPRMVDVGAKPVTRREAVALAEVRAGAGAMELLRSGRTPKGDVLSAARLAGIAAAKRTDEWIPLCHSLPLDAVDVDFRLLDDRVVLRAAVRAEARTGVEMEALTAASAAALAIYDMLKAADKSIVIGPIVLQRKSGGRSGLYERAAAPGDPTWP